MKKTIIIIVSVVVALAIIIAVVLIVRAKMQPKPTVPTIPGMQMPVQTEPSPSSPELPAVACTKEAKLCPDGSSVGRAGPNCEFAACPAVKTPTTAPAPTPTPTPTPSPVTHETHSITIQNFAFSPASISISKGDTVTWTNQDSAPHQIAGGGFGSGALGNGGSYSFTFNTTGTYNYHCAIHPSMTGTITVK